MGEKKFSKKKNSKKFAKFFFEKWKKSEKNNGGNALFFLPENPKLGKLKNRNFWIFLCLLCVHLKYFYETTFWGYVIFQKTFRDVWTPSEYLKNSQKTFFHEKKLYYRNVEKNFFLNRKIKKSGRSAEINQICFGDKNLCIKRVFCINIFQFVQ